MYDLNEENFMIYAIKSYKKPNTIMSEFEEDLKRIKYIKRMLGKFLSTGVLKERLILNHIIILSNVFGVEFTTRMLFYKLPKKYYEVLKPFLLFLHYLPTEINSINGTIINTNDIVMNPVVIQKLREIK
jgi:hypothetical protein